MATKSEKLIEELTKLNVTLTGKETEAELAELLKANKPVAPAKKALTLVWLKNRAYVNDTQRVEAGVYMLDTVPERFAKLPKTEFEAFEGGKVKSMKLIEIARWSGVNPDGLEDEAILDKVINPAFTPFN